MFGISQSLQLAFCLYMQAVLDFRFHSVKNCVQVVVQYSIVFQIHLVLNQAGPNIVPVRLEHSAIVCNVLGYIC